MRQKRTSDRSWRLRLLRVGSLTLGTLFICLVVTLNGCTGWLARSIVWGPNTDKQIDPAADPGPEQLSAMGVARQLRVPVGPPSAELSVWVIDPPAGIAPRGTILVLHGIIDKKETMLGVARDLAASGFRTVPVDLRAHGRSSGQWLTFGVVEARDLSQVLDALETQGLLAGPVGVFGPSYGGAVAIQLAGADPRVRAVVAVCPFTFDARRNARRRADVRAVADRLAPP